MRMKLLICIALIITTFAVYWQVGTHDFVIYDDDTYISRNVHVSAGLSSTNVIWAFTSIEQCNWHPVTWLSHMLDAQFFGINSRGHHLMNVAYHALATLLLFFLLLRLTDTLWRSAFVAALFALHPLHVESVAWAAERKDVLSACFWFLTLILYSYYVKARRDNSKFHVTVYILTLSSFMLGLMAKPMLITLPLIMLLLDYWPLQRIRLTITTEMPKHGESANFLLKEKFPFIACMLFSSAMTFYAQQAGGAVVALEWVPFTLRLQNAFVSYIKYITKTIWPHDLAVLYPLSNSIPLWQVIASTLVLITISVSTIRFARRYPFLPVGWFWFFITLLPVIGLVQVGNQSMADRYMYIPSVGLFMMIAWGVPALFKDICWKNSLTTAASAVLLLSAVVTWRQIGYWKNSISLFQHTLNVTSGNHILHHNLGIAYGRAGNSAAAISEFQAAIKIKPNDSKSRNLLASTLAEQGNIDAAIVEFSRSLSINPNNQEALYALEYWRKQKE